MAAGEIRKPRQWGLRSQFDFGANVTALINKGDEAFLTGSGEDQDKVLALLEDKFEPVLDDDFKADVESASKETDGWKRRHAIYRAYHRLIARRKMYPQRTIGDSVQPRVRP